MVFDPVPDLTFAAMKAICAGCGLEGVSPLDNQVALAGIPPGKPLATEIVRADIALMQRLDAGVFCLDGFRRGPEMDPGTAFEIGYMCALGKPLGGWSRDPRPYPHRVEAYFDACFGLPLQDAGAAHGGGTSGSARDPDGVLVHSEGCLQNAMTEIGIELTGGAVFANIVWTEAFSQAVGNLAARLRQR
jgi:nucleoside 2-deoxyribosyltransferase